MCIAIQVITKKHVKMKKLTKTVSILAICASLSVGSAMAQTTDNAGTGTSTTRGDNDHDNSGKWGLLGLAGLLGLLRPKRKDDDRVRTTTVNR